MMIKKIRIEYPTSDLCIFTPNVVRSAMCKFKNNIGTPLGCPAMSHDHCGHFKIMDVSHKILVARLNDDGTIDAELEILDTTHGRALMNAFALFENHLSRLKFTFDGKAKIVVGFVMDYQITNVVWTNEII